MIYCLDTDICIFALKGRFPSLKRWFQQLSCARIKIPAIVQAELFLGAFKSFNPANAMHLVEGFLEPFEVIPFGAGEAIVYAKVRADLEQSGFLVGPNDLIIAATVLAHQGTLVTHNVKEFQRVPGLLVEDWTR